MVGQHDLMVVTLGECRVTSPLVSIKHPAGEIDHLVSEQQRIRVNRADGTDARIRRGHRQAGGLGCLAAPAVHAAMAEKSDVLTEFEHDRFLHVPIPVVVAQTKQVDLIGDLWRAVRQVANRPY